VNPEIRIPTNEPLRGWSQARSNVGQQGLVDNWCIWYFDCGYNHMQAGLALVNRVGKLQHLKAQFVLEGPMLHDDVNNDRERTVHGASCSLNG
jgi:hypothetical protein